MMMRSISKQRQRGTMRRLLLLPLLVGLLGPRCAAAAGREKSLHASAVPEGLCGKEGVRSESGYFRIRSEGASAKKNYFYWFFESQRDPAADPLVVWLTGGPGCSSTLALLGENGPCSVVAGGAGTVENPFSWNRAANIMWVDQPAGVGFSYGEASDYDHNESQVAEDMFWFVQEFLHAHPELRDNPFYVFGESYGGHYAVAVGHRIWRGNRGPFEDPAHAPIRLSGVAVGNGLTNPLVQFAEYPRMAFRGNPYGIEAVDEKTYEAMEASMPACLELIAECQDDTAACPDALAFCSEAITQPYYDSGLNPYDIRKQCGDDALCYDFSDVDAFLNRPETRMALGVSPEAAETWVSCNDDVNAGFAFDWMKKFDALLPPLMDSEADGPVRVLIYAGDADFVCNFLGNRKWLEQLYWSGAADFAAAPDTPWLSADGEELGTIKTSGPLSFLRVYNAGHMVPMDQPAAALQLLNEFIHPAEGHQQQQLLLKGAVEAE